jgi:hypothetical protein
MRFHVRVNKNDSNQFLTKFWNQSYNIFVSNKTVLMLRFLDYHLKLYHIKYFILKVMYHQRKVNSLDFFLRHL